MRITLLRHPQTLANEKGLIYGHEDYPYTGKGWQQADWAVEQAGRFRFDLVVASPLKRASHLAGRIGRAFSCQVAFDEDLKEMGFGIFEGLTPEEAARKHPEAYDDLMHRFETAAVPGGETYQGFLDRTVGALDKILEKGKDTLVVTHGGVMLVALGRLLGLDAKACWSCHFGNCSFAEFSIGEEGAKLINLVNCEHI